MALGDCAFRKLAEPEIRDGVVDLVALTQRAYLRGCYLYCVVDVREAGYYQLRGPKSLKGIRHRRAYLAGRALERGSGGAPGRGPVPPCGADLDGTGGQLGAVAVLAAPCSALTRRPERGTPSAFGRSREAFCGGASWRDAVAKDVRLESKRCDGR